MSRRKDCPRIIGVYRHKPSGNWMLIIVDRKGDRAAATYPTERSAREAGGRLEAEWSKTAEVRVSEALEDYAEHLKVERGCKPHSIECTRYRVTILLDAGATLQSLTVSGCQLAYARACQRFAVDSHRNMLNETKTFLRWCVSKGMLAKSPMESLKGIGRRSRGKPQLRIDEARKWERVAWAKAEAGEPGAVAALLSLYLGLRCSEIVRRVARDLDDAGRVLWITSSKSEAGKRTLEIPEPLRPLLAKVAAGKAPEDLLFGERSRHYPRDWVKRICREAGVPVVSAHAMRGLHASLALEMGMSGRATALAMGHTCESMTLKHYADRGAVERGRAATFLQVLDGGRKGK